MNIQLQLSTDLISQTFHQLSAHRKSGKSDIGFQFYFLCLLLLSGYLQLDDAIWPPKVATADTMLSNFRPYCAIRKFEMFLTPKLRHHIRQRTIENGCIKCYRPRRRGDWIARGSSTRGNRHQNIIVFVLWMVAIILSNYIDR